MKKIYIHLMMLAAMVVAGAAMTSCSKEEVATGKFKMSINATMAGGNSKALSIEGSTLNATWAKGEKVKVYNGATMLGELTAQTDGSSTTLDGTLDGTVAVNDVLTLKFCSPNYTSQDGTLAYIAANCDYATATVTVASVGGGVVGTQESSAPFVNQQAIVKFTLLDKGNNDAAISPSALTVTDGTSTVELTSIPAATYTTNGASNVLYVAFPAAGSAKTVTLTATVGGYTYTYVKSGVTFTNGEYYEITVKMTEVPAPAGAIKGKFTIKSDGTQVYFSKGNLRYTYGSGTWSFFDHQYDYSSSNHLKSNGIVWDHFGWSSTNANSNYGVNNTTVNDDYTGSFVEWGSNTDLQNALGTGWFTLSNTEWTYLLDTRSGGTFNGNSNARYTLATINTDGTGVNGVILFPDNVTIGSSEVTTAGTLNNYSNWTTKCTTAQWTSLEAKGCVFLPAGGYRTGGSVRDPGNRCDYWMHTDDNSSTAYQLFFKSTGHAMNTDNNIYHGYLVRLVRTVTK